MNLKRNKVWILVPPLKNQAIAGTPWVFRNKVDAIEISIQNKVILLAKGYVQQEGTYCDETYAPVAILEAIRIFIAYTAHEDIKVHHIDVKSAFITGELKEEVYL